MQEEYMNKLPQRKVRRLGEDELVKSFDSTAPILML